jgi:molybdopterin converting factor small subunit
LSAVLVRDEIAYQGPVSGIYHGLKAATRDVCFVTSCDAPFLNFELIDHLLEQISDYDVVVPFWEERFQPLHAIYRTSVVPLLKEQLERGELRPIFLFDKVRTRKIQEEEIRWLDPDGLSFLNMNSPADYEIALQKWKNRQGGPETAPVVASNSVCVTVELFGVARMLTQTQSVALDLHEGATLAQVFSALGEKLPALVGRVLNSGALINGYSCNLNGLNFVRAPDVKVSSGDKIFILSADAGG